MALSQLCHQLSRVSEKLENDDKLLAYRIERIRQNLRLDLPEIQRVQDFSDNEPYPDRYPKLRGPFITVERQAIFKKELGHGVLNELEDIVRKMNMSDNAITKYNLWREYCSRLSQLGCVKPPAMEATCNDPNRVPSAKLLCRYMALSGFIATLLEHDRERDWTELEIREFRRGLQEETGNPTDFWRHLARIWKNIRADIRAGQLSFNIVPRADRDVWFWMNGDQPVHKRGDPPTPDSALEIICALGLPGWETQEDRTGKLGIVAIWTSGISLPIYRPTMLDHMGERSYFFLPAVRDKVCGLTWPLTECCQYNDYDNQSGLEEWTAPTPKAGVPATVMDSQTGVVEPAFELQGLFFGANYAKLFVD